VATADAFDRLHSALAGRYALERELGRGGMATVYLARDLKHERPVAIKVLRPELAAALGPERFLREIKLTAQLDHPHILPLLDSGEAEGFLFYVMPHVEGESLRDRLTREKQLPVDDALQTAREVADALGYAHSHGIIHRDIKPENILLAAGHARVADFGIARAISVAGGEQLTETGLAVGTPAYMSPEQAAGSTELDGRSDIYALGCVLYEMLAGQPPFTGPTVESVVHQHLTIEAQPVTNLRPAVPAPLARALSRALAKTPADRFATAAQFGAALAGGAPGRLPLPAPTSAASKRGSRRLALLGGALIVLAAALVIGRAARNRAADTGASSAVVVMPFENRTGNAELQPLGAVAAEWVTQGLTELPFLRVLDTQGAEAAARRLGAAATPAAVRRETGAGVEVAGSYFLEGDTLQFQAQISSTIDGRVLQSIAGVRAPRDQPMAGVENVRQRVLAGFAASHNKDVSTFQTNLPHPPVYAALRNYVEGLALYMGNHWSDAGQRFLRAALLDSTFLTARIWAAQSGVVARAVDLDEAWARRADSLIGGLRPLRDRLAPFDHARLDFVMALRAEDALAAYQAASRMVDASPGSVDARREAALSAYRTLRSREALRRFQELDPRHGLMRGWEGTYWSYMADIQHRLGRHREELAAARQARLMSDPLDYSELRALAALGRITEFDSLVRVELPRFSHPGIVAFGTAGELMAHGHPEAGRRLAQYGFDHPDPPPPSEPSAARDWLRWQIYYEWEWLRTPPCYLGDRLDTRPIAERAADEWLHWRAELALLLGDVPTAASLAAQLRDPEEHGVLLPRILAAQGKRGAARAALAHWEGRMMRLRGTLAGLELDRASVLVRLGDLDRALEILSEGIGRHFLPYTAKVWDGHAYPDLAPLWSDPRFQALIKPRG
jgi:tetratricopeptide (TPR) repeat protein/TolB-like protein